VIEDVRREGNYALIFDTAAGAIITADPGLDLTDQVLERLRTTAAR
jgi:Skp family chaperone for outer membrane proteins